MDKLKSRADYIVAALAGLLLVWAVAAGGSSGSQPGDNCYRWWGDCGEPEVVR